MNTATCVIITTDVNLSVRACVNTTAKAMAAGKRVWWHGSAWRRW
ncbi:MAG: hypothetical protein ABIV50_03120 [Opitutus sp.]